ncbi:hypothetical protein GUJ93_ZPchr0015g6703 [Zizania palustris]|uniref:Uncharacterized protein n=1 Tax=Zizania palustris TaxID=103762 RepID=A0A8J5SYL4_ZIZPA|nr:hypothetical protein GUJ93_ZPchr0015g6703 [Zizania palustris]
MKSWGRVSPLRRSMMARFMASTLAATSLPSRFALISLAIAAEGNKKDYGDDGDDAEDLRRPSPSKAAAASTLAFVAALWEGGRSQGTDGGRRGQGLGSDGTE